MDIGLMANRKIEPIILIIVIDVAAYFIILTLPNINFLHNNDIIKIYSQYSSAVRYMSHNAPRLGEVADGVRHDSSYHRGRGAQKTTGFHTDRHFAKPLVMCRCPGCVALLHNALNIKFSQVKYTHHYCHAS